MQVDAQARFPDPLRLGQPVPHFRARALSGNPSYSFGTLGGLAVMVLCYGSAGNPFCTAALDAVQARRDVFDDAEACFFGVTMDRQDEADHRIAQQLPGIRHFLDYDGAISRIFSALRPGGSELQYTPQWLVLDRMLRLCGRFDITQADQAFARLDEVISRNRAISPAPVLEIPEVFDPGLCDRLIGYWHEQGGEESGFMRDVDGRTVMLTDPSHKRRRDCTIEDEILRGTIEQRVYYTIKPMIARAFHFDVTRIERYMIACYDAADSGFFKAHRDNTTAGTAHRRFAVSINLNTGDYEGGGLRFPEFGPTIYHAPRGGAIVFSCSLLHEALPVTAGQRFAVLPFLYDEAAAEIRRANNRHLDEGIGLYEG